MNNLTQFNLIILAFLIFILNCDNSRSIIAKAGEEKIKSSEFRELLMKRYPRKNLSEIDIADKKKVLSELIDEKLKVQKAEALGLNKDPEYVKETTLMENRHLVSTLSNKLVIEKFVNDEMVQSNFNLSQFQMKVELIVLGYDSSLIENEYRSEAQAITLAKDLSRRIKNGEEFAEISAIFSDDPITQQKKGLYDPYTPGTFYPELDIELNKAKPNRLEGPIITNQGIFIARVLEKKEKDRSGKFEKERIRRQIFNKFYRDEGIKHYNNLTKEFKEVIDWQISDEGIRNFLTTIKEWSKNDNPRDDQFTENQKAILLGKVDEMDITAGTFIDEFQGNFARAYHRYNNESAMKKILERFIDQHLVWLIMAKKRKLHEQPDVQEKLYQMKESKLIAQFDNYQIREKAIPTDEEITDYYEENKSTYSVPKKIEIWEIAVKDSNLAEEVFQKIQHQKANFQSLAAKYTEKDQMKKSKGYLGYQSIKSQREVIKKAFELGENQIIGPIKENEYFYILKTGKIQPESPKDFEEVKVLVTTAAQRDKEKKIRESVSQTLRQEYKVWINESLLEKIS